MATFENTDKAPQHDGRQQEDDGSNEEKLDVLIVGSGSAGLAAAVFLSRFGDSSSSDSDSENAKNTKKINYKILERRSGPLRIGQADGVQTRTVEIFDSFGIAGPLLDEAYHVLEVAFWSAEGREKEGIQRVRYAMDKETAMSHQPHVILNQARLNQLLLGELDSREDGEGPVAYGCEVTGIEVDSEGGGGDYCVKVEAVDSDGKKKRYRAKYVLGCDGAHSTVRRALGFKMVGDTTDAIWGVMDVHPRTTFPDIRKKAVLNNPTEGINLLLIPREGDSLVRFYIELPPGTQVKDVTLASLQDRARRVFAPYTMEFASTEWWSAYAIGQRHADFFHKNHRVFLTGDACHTHSPKAGQGMNVSLQDGHNIGWKLGMVLRGWADENLVETYVAEREGTAIELIEFDREFTRLFNSRYREEKGITAEQFAQQFEKARQYTAGQAVKYAASAITSVGGGEKELASGVTVGMRFPSAQVVRFSDAKAMQLVKGMPADGRWWVVVFAGNLARKEAAERLQKSAETLDKIVQTYTPADQDPDRILDRILVLSSDRKKLEQEEIPEFFTPVTGKWKMKNLMKTFVDDESYNSGHGHAYDAYGVDPRRGAVVVVRPDQYVAKVTAVEDVGSLAEFFGGFLIQRS